MRDFKISSALLSALNLTKFFFTMKFKKKQSEERNNRISNLTSEEVRRYSRYEKSKANITDSLTIKALIAPVQRGNEI